MAFVVAGRAEAKQFRGVVVSCPRFGQIWASSDMDDSLTELKKLGVTSVQIHPYASVDRSGTVSSTRQTHSDAVAESLEKIKNAGMVPFLKPHLAYWGQFSWRGEIEFSNEVQRKRFFSTYREFILKQARLAEKSKVPLFAVGTELKKLLRHTAEWRSLIAEVRKVYSGQLVYAANWDSVEGVRFWKDLDQIGVQFYFPLAAKDGVPLGSQKYKERLERVLDQLRGISVRLSRPVMLTEIGLARSQSMLTQPWKPANSMNESVLRKRQEVAEHLLKRLGSVSWIKGLYWWKWMPGNSVHFHRDFSMRDPEMRKALTNDWGKKQ